MLDVVQPPVTLEQELAPVDSFWRAIERLGARAGIARHPFYLGWAAGELELGELALYAAEFDHGVRATAAVWRRAVKLAPEPLAGRLAGQAAVEQRHVDCWREFARATGWSGAGAWYYGEEPLPATVSWARAWSGTDCSSLAQQLVTACAVEQAQACTARLQLGALLERYGFEDGPATEYFRLHTGRVTGDQSSGVVAPGGEASGATAARSALSGLLLAGEDPAPLELRAELVYRRYREMLDGLAEVG